MEITDLMVGDLLIWKEKCEYAEEPVLNAICRVGKINGLYRKEETVDIFTSFQMDKITRPKIIYGINPKKLHPIPLTKEILEKNGWTEHLNTGFFNEDKKHLVELTFEDGIAKWTKEDNRYQVMVLKYVHQLQNVLNIAGVKKKIIRKF